MFPNHWMVVSYYPNRRNELRVGWTITKNVGNAVFRNKIKRWIREYFRKDKSFDGFGVDLNIYLRKKKDVGFYKSVNYEQFKEELRKSILLVQKKVQ